MKGWLDNFGKADNANESNVSLPEGFVGVGYDTKGRNYSPAWGGQFAMGGSIPGSVGFTYARVAGAAPSKGKYAKKTMASAQIGKNVEKDETNIDTGISNKIAGLELQQNPEYQHWKYRQSLPQLRQAPGRGEELMRQGLKYADVATDVMQLGNFIPHPTAQAVGKVGNVAGTIVDGLQAATDAYKGNYLSAGINLGSAALPTFLGANSFRRNAMNLRPGDPLYSLTEQARKPYAINLNKSDTDYLELFSNVKGMTDKSLIYNRALLGALGAETIYDALPQSGSPNVISSSDIEGVYPKSQSLPTKTESADPAIAKKLADYMNSKSRKNTGEVYGRKSYYPIDGFENGGEIPSAQSGIMAPMLLARNVLNYFYPSEEATSAVSAAPVEYKKGLTDELLKRQAYKESTFNPAAVSPAGYKGLTQIGEEVLTDYSKKKGGKKLDPFNPKDAVELQKFAMDDLYNASFINKPNQPDSVRIAKTLAAYNWGRGNLFNYLNEQKQKGVDIYDSYDWLNDLPKETSDYVNKILLQEDQSFNKNYKIDSTNPKYKDVTSLYGSKKFGGDIPSAQNGQEMRFYQNGLDWKPKSMQDGGVQRISTSDPRYPELYKNRQVGAYYDGAYSLPDLPEVVVTGKDERLKEAMYEASNKFGMNVLGLMSAPQVVTMEALTGKQQTPSEAWGFQNTGGWLDSPTSFGKNVSNFAMDAVLDPVNLIGVGIADDIARASLKSFGKKAISQSPSPQMMVDDTVEGLSRNLPNVSNTGRRSDPYTHLEAFNKKKEEVLESLRTPEGRKRLEAYMIQNPYLKYSQFTDDAKTVDDLISDFEKTTFEAEAPRTVYVRDNDGKLMPTFEKNPDGSIKLYPVSPNNAYNWYRDTLSNPSFVSIGENFSSYDAPHVLEHEFAHLFQRGYEVKGVDDVLENISLKPNDELGKPTFQDFINRFNPFSKNLQDVNYSNTGNIYGTGSSNPYRTSNLLDQKKYFSTGGGKGLEKAAFAAEIRENLLQRGLLKNRYDEITPEMLDKHYKLYNKTGGDKYNLRLYDIMEPGKKNFSILSEALNKMPQVVLPVAGGAAAVSSALQDDQQMQNQKNGGITKDNLGYWNPDNWGQPVEIDSNNITMEGVYEPLLGISDTGDTKLMQPGKNYKFKGKKVTEFPVAKLGINQLDAQPMKKLNQLLNFTNNPDKDNWLDKYN